MNKGPIAIIKSGSTNRLFKKKSKIDKNGVKDIMLFKPKLVGILIPRIITLQVIYDDLS